MKDGEKQKMEPMTNDIPPFSGMSFLMELSCPVCGHDIELWTSQEETKCFVCGYKIFDKESIIH